jgi:hypothetical protein
MCLAAATFFRIDRHGHFVAAAVPGRFNHPFSFDTFSFLPYIYHRLRDGFSLTPEHAHAGVETTRLKPRDSRCSLSSGSIFVSANWKQCQWFKQNTDDVARPLVNPETI